MIIMLFGEKFKEMKLFTNYLKNEHKLVICGTRGEVHEQLQSNLIGAVVAFEDDFSFIQELIKAHPLVNYALLSAQKPGVFHEMTEGYGLFMQLPVAPEESDAIEMVNKLERLSTCLTANHEGEAL